MDQAGEVHNYSQDYFFDPAGAYEDPQEAADRLQNLVLSGNFTVDAKAYLKSVGQGLHALEKGDEVEARRLLTNDLEAYRKEKPTDPAELDLVQQEIRVLEAILK